MESKCSGLQATTAQQLKYGTKQEQTERIGAFIDQARRIGLEKVEEWKKGFYYIAEKAQVPIMIAYFDYAKKEAGFKGLFYPTGDAEKDIRTIRESYRDVTACHPENFVKV